MKLHKSKSNKKICGVCGGLAESLNIDATIIRIAAVALTILTSWTFATVILYFACALIFPTEE